MWALLRSLTEAGTTVVAVCSEAPEGVVAVSTTMTAPPREQTNETHETHETHEKETVDALPETGRA